MGRKKLSTTDFLKRVKDADSEMFSKYDYSITSYINMSTKVDVICPDHGIFQVWPGDHMKGMSGCKLCISEKRKQTNIKKYGVSNYFQRTDLIQLAMNEKHGVTNPGLMPDHLDKIKTTNLERYGKEWSSHLPDVDERRKQTSLDRYGVEYPMQNSKIAKKSMKAKIQKGGFTKSNSSKEASEYIKQYIHQKQYDISQCAFASPENNLYEWGLYHDKQWILFDLVVFEHGYRGSKDHIIEILEYHGPFHYTSDDVLHRGDHKAYPWRSNKTTIKESFERDIFKYKIAKSLTDNVKIVWSSKLYS